MVTGSVYWHLRVMMGVLNIEVLKCFLLNYYLILSQKGKSKYSLSCQNLKKEKEFHPHNTHIHTTQLMIFGLHAY